MANDASSECKSALFLRKNHTLRQEQSAYKYWFNRSDTSASYRTSLPEISNSDEYFPFQVVEVSANCFKAVS